MSMTEQHLKTTQDFINETLTAKQLIAILRQFPPNTKLFISSDSEGNSYGTLDKKYNTMYSKEDNALALMQFADHLDDAQIMPIMDARIMKEIEEEATERKRRQDEKNV